MMRLLLSCFVSASIAAATYYSDEGVTGTSGSGTDVSPWGLTNAIEHLSAGDTLIIKSGTNFGNFKISKQGTSGNPITIQGQNGAILDSATYQVTSWTRATEYAQPVYKLTSPPFEVGGVIVNGRNLDGWWKLPATNLNVNFSEIGRANPYMVTDSAYDNGKSTNNWWAGIAGGWYQTNGASGPLYIRFADGSDPATKDIWLSRLDGYAGTSPTDDRTPYASTVLLESAQYVTLRNLEIRGARFPIAFRHVGTSGSHHNTIESNYVHHGLSQILIAVNDTASPTYGGFISSSNNVIRYNAISEDRYVDNYGAWASTDPTQTWPLVSAYGFNKMRYGRTVGGFGIQVNGGWQTEIYCNVITNCNGGVLTSTAYTASGPMLDLITITTNYFADMSEAAVSPNIGAKDMRIFDNTVTNVHYPFRLNDVGLPTAAYQRDWYIGFNTAANPIGRGDGIYVYSGVGPSTSAVRVWIYNNSFAGCAKGLHINATMTTYGLPYWRIIGNIFSTVDGVRDSNGGAFVSAIGIGVVDNNLFRVTPTSQPWFGGTNVVSGAYAWSTNAPTLEAVTEALGLAVDTSTSFNYKGTSYPALPRTIAGYYSGIYPNAGWDQGLSTALPGQANTPSPSTETTGVSITADLGWVTGSSTTNFVVYFGTSSPGTLRGTQSSSSYDPGTMSNSTQYFWRIDSQGPGGTRTGNVWSFTTAAAGSGGGNPQSGRGVWRPQRTILR